MEKLKGLIIILVVVGGVYYAWNMIPPYLHNYEFQDDLDDIVRKATYMNISDDDLKQSVIRKAQSIGIALKEEQITISKVSNVVAISVSYRVHVDMLVHPVDLDFQASSHNKVLGT